MFHERLNKALAVTGTQPSELARRSNMSRGQVSNYLNAKRTPGVDIIVRFAKALGVSADFLLGLSDDPTPAIGNSNLNDKERNVIALWRQEKYTEAISIIASDSIK